MVSCLALKLLQNCRASSPTILLLVAKVLRPVNSMGRSARTAWLYRCGCDALWCGCCWEQNLEIVVGVFGLRAGPADVWCIYRKKMNFSLNPHFTQDDCAHPFTPPSTKCSFVEEASPRCFRINRIICAKNNATGRWYGFGPRDRNCTSRYLAPDTSKEVWPQRPIRPGEQKRTSRNPSPAKSKAGPGS